MLVGICLLKTWKIFRASENISSVCLLQFIQGLPLIKTSTEMSDNENENNNSLSNPTPVLDAVKMGSVNGTVAPDKSSGVVSEHGYFWVGIKLQKSLIFGGLGYVAGGVMGVYGGFFGLFLLGFLALHLYLFVL